jgi:hypothetical protein
MKIKFVCYNPEIMSLLICDECKKEISDKARMCVHCGYQLNQSMFIQPLGFDGTLFRLMIAAGIILGFPYGIIGWALAAFGVLLLLIRSLR